MPDDIRARVQKLIALACSNPSEHEARSAALKACRLIQEHKLLDARPSAPAPPAAQPWQSREWWESPTRQRPSPPTPPTAQPWPPPSFDEFTRLHEEYLRRVMDQQQNANPFK